MAVRGAGLYGGTVPGPYAAPVDDYQQQPDRPAQAALADVDGPVSGEEWAAYWSEVRAVAAAAGEDAADEM